MKKLLFVLICTLLLLTGCSKENASNDDDIIILFTNDTHGAIDDILVLLPLQVIKMRWKKNLNMSR